MIKKLNKIINNNNNLNLSNNMKITHKKRKNFFDLENFENTLYYSINSNKNFFYKRFLNESVNIKKNFLNLPKNLNLSKNKCLLNKNEQNISKIKIKNNTNISNKNINFNILNNKRIFSSPTKTNKNTTKNIAPVHRLKNYNSLYAIYKKNYNEKDLSSNNQIKIRKIIDINNKTNIKKNFKNENNKF